MNRLIYISPLDMGNINGVSELRNSGTFSKYIDSIDFHFALFSALYQSGVNYFQIDSATIPVSLSKYPFWKDKLTSFNPEAYDKAIIKADAILEGKLNFEENSAKTRRLHTETIALLSNLFYSCETGTPFLNTNFSFDKHLEFMKERMDKELWKSLKILSSLINCENIQTITPKYTVLKDDIKRFEDISASKLFSDYSDSLGEMTISPKFNSIKKEISINSLKLYNKYGNNLDLKETAFSFIKFNKSILDTFVSKIPSTIGDFVITSLEKLTKEKRRVSFYEIEEARFSKLFCNIFDDTIRNQGYDKFKLIIEELKNEKTTSNSV